MKNNTSLVYIVGWICVVICIEIMAGCIKHSNDHERENAKFLKLNSSMLELIKTVRENIQLQNKEREIEIKLEEEAQGKKENK